MTDETSRSQSLIETLFAAAIVVVALFIVSVVVIVLLSRIGPVTATVDGIIEQGGANIAFAAAGVVAAFISSSRPWVLIHTRSSPAAA